jgi:ribosomal protein L29
MKTKDKTAIMHMDVKELEKQARELREKLTEASITKKTKQIKNSRVTRTERHKLAVVLTALRAKELAHE